MKKENSKRFLVGITSLLQLVILLITFINSEKIVTSKYVEALRSTSGFGIFVVIIIFAILFWDDVKYTKNRLIAGNIVLFLFVSNIMVKLIAIVNILMLAFVKYERKEKVDMKEATAKLMVSEQPMTKNTWIWLVILFVIYFGQNFIKSEWLDVLSPFWLIVFAIAIHIVLFVLAVIPFWTEIKQGTRKIASNFKLTIRYMLRLFTIMIILMFIATYISYGITDKLTSVNQENIESLPMYITIPLAVIWAPFVEEGVFRGGIRKIIKHKLLFIIISGVIFGFLHAIEEATLGIAIATSLPYVAIGMVFAYSYVRTNNLAVNILFHLLYNSLAVLVSTLK